jgi:hypothetical protein
MTEGSYQSHTYYQRGIYFYLKGDNWEAGVSLPGEMKVGLGD